MTLFAAGVEPAELQQCAEEGLCEGVVVLGPAAMDEAPEARARLAALGRSFSGPVLVEVASVGDVGALVRELAALGPRFVARIPFAAGGAATFTACKAAGLATNAAACASMDETVEAARAGAAWVSPALTGPAPGAASGADYDLFRKARALFKALGLDTQILVGPLRDAGVLFDSTVMGAHVTLVSPAVLRKLTARRP